MRLNRNAVVAAFLAAFGLIALIALLLLRGSGGVTAIEGQLVAEQGAVDYSTVSVEVFPSGKQSCDFAVTNAEVSNDGSFTLPVRVLETNVSRDDCVFIFGFRLTRDTDAAFTSSRTKTITTQLPSGETHVLPDWGIQSKEPVAAPDVENDVGDSGAFDYDPETCEALQLQYDINKRLSDEGLQDDFTSEYQRFMDLYNCP